MHNIQEKYEKLVEITNIIWGTYYYYIEFKIYPKPTNKNHISLYITATEFYRYNFFDFTTFLPKFY